MLKHTGTVLLETPRLLLTRLTPADAESVHRNWGADPVVYRYMTSPIMPALSDVKQFIDRKCRSYSDPRFYYWAIRLKQSPEDGVIGMATLTEVSDYERSANLAYSLGQAWWGQGYATEAAGALVRLAMDTVGFHRLYGSHFTDNARSGAVLRRVGMALTSGGNGPVSHHGEMLTYESYVLTARAWRRMKKGGGVRAIG